MGAVSEDFTRVYERYPNPFRKLQAAQTFAELAEQTLGGEAALADAIEAAFDGGMLNHKPYNNDHCPKFETLLAERLWEEAAPAPVVAPIAETLQQRDARALREGTARTAAALDEVRRKSAEAEAAAVAAIAAKKQPQSAGGAP